MKIPFRPLILSYLVSAALPGPAHAFGLNNIYGSQTIGKPFYAEIPLQAAPNVSESCIRLRPVDAGGEFFMADLKASVSGPANARRLIITSSAPVRNPMIQFLVDVQCGESTMVREYLLLADNAPFERSPRKPEQPAPEAPAATPTAAPTPVASGLPSASDGQEVVLLSAATTLNAMARAIYPDDRAARDNYRAAFAAANPDLFAGKDSIGSIPLAAGTRLKAPAGVVLPGIGSGRSDIKPSVKNVAGAASSAQSVESPRSVPRVKGETKKSDRLTVGIANPQMQMLADAIMRLEASTVERDKINSELVGGVSSALNSIIELKERISAQDDQVKQLITLQIENERRQAKEREESLGTLGLLGLILAAMFAGGGLITLHHTLSSRRETQRGASTGAVLDWNDLPDDTVSHAASPADWPVDKEPETTPGDADADAPPVPPVLPVAPVAVVTSVPASASPPPAASSAEDAKQDMELDGLLDLFGEQKASVTATIQRLRATRSRDPEQWLALVRQARVAGLMNSEDMQLIIGEFKRLFNASLEHEPSDVGLEHYPHVARQVQATWGRHEGLTLLNSLLFDDREGGRSGFPEQCFEELVTLRDVLAARVAIFGEDPVPTAEASARNVDKVVEEHLIEFELPVPPAGTP